MSNFIFFNCVLHFNVRDMATFASTVVLNCLVNHYIILVGKYCLVLFIFGTCRASQNQLRSSKVPLYFQILLICTFFQIIFKLSWLIPMSLIFIVFVLPLLWKSALKDEELQTAWSLAAKVKVFWRSII